MARSQSLDVFWIVGEQNKQSGVGVRKLEQFLFIVWHFVHAEAPKQQRVATGINFHVAITATIFSDAANIASCISLLV